MLSLPLLIMLTLPSSSAPDPLVQRRQPLHYGPGGDATPESQQRWIEQLVPMLLAKQPVQAIFWNQLSDATPHDFPHGGLFDAAGSPKPILDTFRLLHEQDAG